MHFDAFRLQVGICLTGAVVVAYWLQRRYRRDDLNGCGVMNEPESYRSIVLLRFIYLVLGVFGIALDITPLISGFIDLAWLAASFVLYCATSEMPVNDEVRVSRRPG